jgi:starvation-inducible DNA-binding protein
MKIDPKEVQQTIDLLYTAFGNNFTYYLKTHNFHWTVMGKDFPQYHKMLEHIYEDAQGSIDDYAEQLRRLGVFPKGDYRDIMNGTQLSDPTESITDPMEIFQTIDTDLDVIVSTLQDAAYLAGCIGEYGLQNFLGDRINEHRKTQWMVDAILGEQADMMGQDIEPLEQESGDENTQVQ